MEKNTQKVKAGKPKSITEMLGLKGNYSIIVENEHPQFYAITKKCNGYETKVTVSDELLQKLSQGGDLADKIREHIDGLFRQMEGRLMDLVAKGRGV